VRETDRTRALEGCQEAFLPPARAPHKRYCSDRHQRIAEKRRFRERHVETAICKRCQRRFERETTTKRRKIHCSPRCERLAKSKCLRGIHPPG
jgi:hypothetical protein